MKTVNENSKAQEKDRLLQQLVDREAIRDCLLRGALGNDLQDAVLWKSAYWPDAYEDHAWYRGNAHAFVDETVPMLVDMMDEAWHQVGNMMIQVEGDHARAQTYYFSYCRLKQPNEGRRDLFAGGRYVDKLEKRNGEWRIIERFTKSDWVRNFDDSIDWNASSMNGYVPDYTMRAPDDPVRRFFGDTLSAPSALERRGGTSS